MTEGIGGVLARIQDIQGRIGALSGATATAVAPTVRSSGTAGALGSGASSQGFASQLATALGQSGDAAPSTGTPGAAAGTGTVGSAATPTTPDQTAGGGATVGLTTGERVVADAKRYLGVPYVWGGTNPDKGLDCSGLVQRVYADLGIDLPRVSRDQARAGRPVASVSDARPGDIVAFGSPVHHVGIYIGDGKMIAAPYPGKNVRIEPLFETPSAIRRIVDDKATSFTAAARSATPAAGTSGLDAGTPYAALFAAASARNDLPAGLLAAVAKAESGFDPKVVSPAGAQGLMQLMPATARGLGVNAFDPAQAVDGAARLLKHHLKEFGSVPLALAAYNAGPGAVHRYGGIPPYAETQAYVVRVQKYQKELVR